jgi:hypothetical protein
MKELKEYIENEIKEVDRIMIDRYLMNNDTHWIPQELYDADKNPFDDSEDRENHSYDLGRLKTLQEILKQL